MQELERAITFLGEAGTPAYDAATSGSGRGTRRRGIRRRGRRRRERRENQSLRGRWTGHAAARARRTGHAAGRARRRVGSSGFSAGASPAPTADVRETLRLVSEAHRSLGRTALCLSGGGALAMYHFGVIKVLLEEGLLPQVISGTSGGSIVAAFISMFPEEELLRSIRPDLSSRHGVRWFPPIWKMVIHFVQHSVLMSGKDFAETTKAYFGDVTFAEAFAISKRAVSIQISVGWSHGFVLNHFTAPQVVIRTAVNASCALPGLMEPFELLAKDETTGELIPFHPPGVSSFDGTITADIPSARLTELFNCNNFIVSQVNPHINFVLHLAEEGQGRRLRQARSTDRRAAVTKLLRVAGSSSSTSNTARRNSSRWTSSTSEWCAHCRASSCRIFAGTSRSYRSSRCGTTGEYCSSPPRLTWRGSSETEKQPRGPRGGDSTHDGGGDRPAGSGGGVAREAKESVGAKKRGKRVGARWSRRRRRRGGAARRRGRRRDVDARRAFRRGAEAARWKPPRGISRYVDVSRVGPSKYVFA